jgi:hypothetical protein
MTTTKTAAALPPMNCLAAFSGRGVAVCFVEAASV